MDRIGQPDVRDAVVGKNFRFPQLRAADADRAGLDLHAGDDRAFVRFGVWTQPEARMRRERLHARDIGCETGGGYHRVGGAKSHRLAHYAFGVTIPSWGYL
jgi:hypothetical protein